MLVREREWSAQKYQDWLAPKPRAISADSGKGEIRFEVEQ